MSEIALREEGLLTALGVEHTPTSLTLPIDLAYEDYETIGAFIGMVGDASRWWLADWLAQGEHLYGEKVAQAAELTRRAPQTLVNAASISRRVPPQRRRPKVSFTAHAEVASLEPADQKRWLKMAEVEDLRTHELRARIQAERNGTPDVLDEQSVCKCCGKAF